MMRPDDLIAGNHYFVLWYYDHNHRDVPYIKTWIYHEKITDENAIDVWVFRSPDSDEDSDEGVEELPLKEEQLLMVLDIHGLQRALFEIEDLYPTVQSPSRPVNSVQLERKDFSDLEKCIDEFLTSEANTLIVAIRYTNHGISLLKRNAGLEVGFLIHWRIEPEIERKVRALFSVRNITPSEDYCASRPRVRVLNYQLPMERAFIIDIAVNIFTVVYQISAKDELKYQIRQIGKK